VLVCSLMPSGPAIPLYAGGMANAGAAFAGDLGPWQARLLLAAAIAAPGDPTRTIATWLA
jgi:L-asparaginase